MHPEIDIRSELVNPREYTPYELKVSLLFPAAADDPIGQRLEVPFPVREGDTHLVDYAGINRELGVLVFIGTGWARSDISLVISATPEGWKVADCSGEYSKTFTSLREAEDWYINLSRSLMETERFKPYAAILEKMGCALSHDEGGYKITGSGTFNLTPAHSYSSLASSQKSLQQLEDDILKPLKRIWDHVTELGGTMTVESRPGRNARITSDDMWSSIEDSIVIKLTDKKELRFPNIAALVAASDDFMI